MVNAQPTKKIETSLKPVKGYIVHDLKTQKRNFILAKADC